MNADYSAAAYPLSHPPHELRDPPALEHAIEMGHDSDREPPFFFMKPADAVVPSGTLPFPTQTRELHHEVELVVALGEGGREIRGRMRSTTSSGTPSART